MTPLEMLQQPGRQNSLLGVRCGFELWAPTSLVSALATGLLYKQLFQVLVLRVEGKWCPRALEVRWFLFSLNPYFTSSIHLDFLPECSCRTSADSACAEFHLVLPSLSLRPCSSKSNDSPFQTVGLNIWVKKNTREGRWREGETCLLKGHDIPIYSERGMHVVKM